MKEQRIMKKIIALLMAVLMTAGMLAACSSTPAEGASPTVENTKAQAETAVVSGEKEKVTLKVWADQGELELTEKLCNEFAAEHPEKEYTFEYGAVGAVDGKARYLEDPAAAADVFLFADDQLVDLVKADALYEVTRNTDAIIAANTPGSINAATYDGTLYGYPMTSDNGYFMIYDSSVIPAEHVDSLEDIIADCEAAGRGFSMELETSAWYNVAFFFATGCHSNWTMSADGKSFESVDDDFNSDNGVIALKGMKKLLNSTAYKSSSSADDFSAAIPAAVVIVGTWGTSSAKAALGDNYACTDLPSFTVDGNSYHLGSFSGNKLVGVKPQTDPVKTAVLQKLALYLTNEKCQLARFDAVGWGPSNKAAQQSEKVAGDPALAALAAQSAYATPQGQIDGSWWDIAKVYATAAKEATTDEELKAALESYETSIKGLFSMSAEEREAFTVIGSINGDSWSVDLPMTKQDDGSWLTDEAYQMDAGVEFKVRQGKAWDVAYGTDGNNFVVETAGTYKVRLTLNGEEGTVELVPAE